MRSIILYLHVWLFFAINLLKLIYAQTYDARPHVVAENLKQDYVKLGVLFEKYIINQTIYGQQSSKESVDYLSNMQDIFQDINVKDTNQSQFNISSVLHSNKGVFYVLRQKKIYGNQIQLLLQLNKEQDFYINIYNTFIKCIKITISCRDDSFIDLKAEDVNEDLRFQYYNQNFETISENKTFDISLSNFTVLVSNYNEPFNLRILRKSSNVLLFSLDERFMMSDKFIHLKYQASSNQIFGLGERNYKFKLEFNNSAYTLWNRDSPQNLETADASGGHNTYGSHPIYLMKDTNPSLTDGASQTDSNFHLVYLQNVNAMDIFLTKQREIEYRITGGILDFKIIVCNSPKTCVQRYNKFLGKQALMPLWAYGFHQSRWGYQNIYEVKQIIEEYNTIEFPVESVFLDIDYMINYNTFTVNETSFPLNNKTIMQDIDKRIVPILDVAIGLELKHLQVRTDAINYNVAIKDIEGAIHIGRVWPGFTLFPDFENPTTKIFWQNYTYHFMKEYNISSFWLDMNEYANFCHGICEGLPYLPGSRTLENMSLSIISIHGLSGNLEFNAHNINGYLHSYSTYRAVKYGMQNPLPFLISRSTIPGSGNYVAHWAGDNSASYKFMAYSVASLFNFHIFGIDFTGSDICGFMNNTSEQLCNRWGQLGSLYPFSRNHNHEKLLSQEFFTFEEYRGALHSFRQKYSLLKYYYTLSLNNTYKIQPAFINYPNESCLYLDAILETHIMIGDNILSVPVLIENQTAYEIYFPQNRWFNISSGEMYENKENKIQRFNNYFNQAIDLFVQEGHIVFQQHEKVLSSMQLSNRYHLKCGFSQNEPYQCTGMIMSINDFSEKNVHLKCTQPFNCLYKLTLEYINNGDEQKIILKIQYQDDIQYNQPQSIHIDSITIFSDIFNQTHFKNNRTIFKNQSLYKQNFELKKLDNGIIILTKLHILYDSIFEINL